MLSIGRFAHFTGLTVKALRHYDSVGLLRPASVDPDTGYRRYAPAQLDDALVIRRLRALDLPVDDIRVVLRGGDADLVLGRHRERIEVKDVAPQEVALIRGAARVVDAIAELLDHAGEHGTGPPFAVRTPELEVALPVAPGVQGSGRIEVRAEAGFRALAALYDGPHERLAAVSRGLWEALRREAVEPAGEPREVYLNGEGLIELVCPLAVPPSWLPSPGLFTEPLGR